MIDGNICLVTGSTSGIGKEIALGLARIGGSVVLVGRDAAKCEATAKEIAGLAGKPEGSVSYLPTDLSLQSSVRKAAEDFKARYNRLDILVNNAGIFRARRELTDEGIECTLAVNHLAPFLLTNLLVELMKGRRSRIVTTSSVAHRGASIDFQDLQFASRRYSGIKAYGQSKLANILFTVELARRLEGTGVTANCFHPGGVRTGLAHGNPWYYRLLWLAVSPFLLSPEKGADTGLYLATSAEVDDVSGRYFVKRKEALPSREARDRDAAARLWQVSDELTRLERPA
jgi:NAD(P)-dependent dehydrogenase (short-subunit alcohol dehydrogenase family)